jgi:hypothetical protein
MAFFESLEAKKAGELGIKAGQLEASVMQEERFLAFSKNLDLSLPSLYKSEE